jgi:hypothetical protein
VEQSLAEGILTNVHGFFIWIETSAFSVWVRESTSFFAFPTILSLHTIGMGVVAGVNALVALRILGVAPGVPLIEMKRFFPVMWFGFWLNAASGVALLIGYPTKALTNPVFYTKLAFIALAMVTVRFIGKRVFRDSATDINVAPQKGKLLAGASLACWAGAITAGRLLAYTYIHLTSD